MKSSAIYIISAAWRSRIQSTNTFLGEVVSAWRPGPLTKCFVSYTLGKGGRRQPSMGSRATLVNRGAVLFLYTSSLYPYLSPPKPGVWRAILPLRADFPSKNPAITSMIAGIRSRLNQAPVRCMQNPAIVLSSQLVLSMAGKKGGCIRNRGESRSPRG